MYLTVTPRSLMNLIGYYKGEPSDMPPGMFIVEELVYVWVCYDMIGAIFSIKSQFLL